MASKRYPATARLVRPGEFKKVFAQGRRHADACFAVLTLGNECETARLGLVMPRRQLRRAVDRNRVKRLVREHFRQCLGQLPTLDIVVMARTGLQDKPNAILRASLERHWQKIITQCDS